MSRLSRLERFEQRTEWPLAGVALAFLGLYSVRVSGQPAGGRGIAIEVHTRMRCLLRLRRSTTSRGCIWPNLAAGGSSGTCFDLAIVVLPFLRPLRLLSLAVVVKALQRAIGHTIRGG